MGKVDGSKKRSYETYNDILHQQIVKVPIALQRPMSPDESKQIYRMIERSRTQMLLNWPFFAVLAMHLVAEEDYTIPTAATDGKRLYYNPHFIKKMKETHRNWVIAHEVLHPALKHIWRRNNRNAEKWNYACDYAIHWIMMQFLQSQNGNTKSKMEMPPGCLYDPKYDGMSAEEIYNLLPNDFKDNAQFGQGGPPQSEGQGGSGQSQPGQNPGQQGAGGGDGEDSDGQGMTPLDDHSKWYKPDTQNNKEAKATQWEGNLIAAAEASKHKFKGDMPGFLQKLLKSLTEPQKDWRVLLHEFIQQEINDYSFNPPDRRYSDCDFFLPDFNDTVDLVKDLLFFIDTSGSMSDNEIRACFSEIAGAIHQFSGKLFGKVGFFDAVAYGLTDFDDVGHDITKIRPVGGGGTSFAAPFEYIDKNLPDTEIAGIIMLTDGECNFPDEKVAKGVPVLWVFTNKDKTSPWGLHTNLKID